MKTLAIPFVLFINTISWSQNFPSAPENKAVVYFFRTSASGSAINFTYLDSIRVIGKFSGQNYFRYECDPGLHLLWARSENRDFIEANFEAGKIYLIDAVPRIGAIKAAVALEPTAWHDSKRMEKISKLMEKKPARTWTSQELDALTKDFADPIARGIEKYKEDKALGKAFTKILPGMNYPKP
jgi:hypothetical protein